MGIRCVRRDVDVPEDWLLTAMLARERAGSQVRTPAHLSEGEVCVVKVPRCSRKTEHL